MWNVPKLDEEAESLTFTTDQLSYSSCFGSSDIEY